MKGKSSSKSKGFRKCVDCASLTSPTESGKKLKFWMSESLNNYALVYARMSPRNNGVSSYADSVARVLMMGGNWAGTSPGLIQGTGGIRDKGAPRGNMGPRGVRQRARIDGKRKRKISISWKSKKPRKYPNKGPKIKMEDFIKGIRNIPREVC